MKLWNLLTKPEWDAACQAAIDAEKVRKRGDDDSRDLESHQEGSDPPDD